LLRIALILVVVVLTTVGTVYRVELARLYTVVTLFDQGRIVANFSSMGKAFHTASLSRGTGPVSTLPEGDRIDLPSDLRTWFQARNTTSLIVLHHGKVVFEEYYLGTQPEDLRIAWSISKSWLSVLLGIVIDEGDITSLDDPVVRYAPSLAGSAYDGASIRDVVTMSSGVAFDEDYLNFWSDINRMGRLLAIGGSMDDFATSYTELSAPPGRSWNYVSIDTHVIGMVIRGATGRSVPELMVEKIIEPLGLEADVTYISDSHGVAFVLGGLNLRSRDQARFTAMVLAGGVWEGRRIAPRDWLLEATRPQANTAPGEKRYGFHWWIPTDAPHGEFQAEGIYGQYLYFNRARDVTIVMTAADRGFREPGVDEGNTFAFRQITEIASGR
jgi:CubicO group peptidase (beta-lactamase class C family)